MVDLDRPTAKPLMITPRRPGLFYDVMDHGDCFYIRANSQARDFKVVVAPRDAPDEANWRDVVPHRDGCFIADATLFKNFLVVLAREESRPRLAVHDLTSGEAHEIAFSEETYALGLGTVYEFELAAPEVPFFLDGPARGDLRLRLRHARPGLSSNGRVARLRSASAISRGSSSPAPRTARACRCRC